MFLGMSTVVEDALISSISVEGSELLKNHSIAKKSLNQLVLKLNKA
jgi:hypothetical protein